LAVSRVINPVLMRPGITPTLAVRGRSSGVWRTVPVNVLDRAGQRYLVAPRGDTQWVRNLRATSPDERRWPARIEPFRSTEIDDNEKPPIIEAYLARWGYHVRPYFRALPNAADHPRFRIERPSPSVGREVIPRSGTFGDLARRRGLAAIRPEVKVATAESRTRWRTRRRTTRGISR
jgi:hypothetical protein